MSNYQCIKLDVSNRIATLTLNMPETRNSISGELAIGEIERACHEVQCDDDVSVMILTAEGKSFSSGGNVKAMRERSKEFKGGPGALQENYRRGIQRIPLALSKMDVPIIAAVNGHAIGAGCDFAMMCDIRIASTQAMFGETFLNLGIIPGDGGSWYLTRLLGYQRAAELTFTGRLIKAQEALELGLVLTVVKPEKLMEETLALARNIASKPPVALRLTKRILKQAATMQLPEFLDVIAITQSIVQTSAEHRQAIDAFFAREDERKKHGRPPA